MKRDWKRNIKVVWLCGAMIGFVTVSASWSTPARAQVIILNAQTPNADAIYDVPALISTPLNAKVLKSSEEDGIVTEEVMFHSEMDGAKSVDIFAIFSYPKGAKNLPAFIWNQTGLAQASSYLTVLGARRGYAALCIDFPNTGYRSTGNYAINSGLEVSENPRDSPIYHGAVALLKAVSYLQSRPEVNGDRIGMVGFSAGAMLTLATTLSGHDAKPAFIGLIYGPLSPVTTPADAPPMFVALAADDPFFANSGVGLIDSWRSAKRAVEFHLYEQGGHGFGMYQKTTTSTGWFDAYLRWLGMHGMLKSKS